MLIMAYLNTVFEDAIVVTTLAWFSVKCLVKMWMAYIVEIEIKDIQSGIRRLEQEFSHLGFDAMHEANYGMGRLMSMKDCIELGERYDKAGDVCTSYLEGDLTIHDVAEKLKEIRLGHFLLQLEKYLPQSVVDLLPKPGESDNEESANEESANEESDNENGSVTEKEAQSHSNIECDSATEQESQTHCNNEVSSTIEQSDDDLEPERLSPCLC